MITARYTESVIATMRKFYATLSEKHKRLYAATESIKLGYGGDTYIASILGCGLNKINDGKKDLQDHDLLNSPRIRRAGGGKKKRLSQEPELETIFLEIISEHTAGDPMNPEIKWTNLTVVGIQEKFLLKGKKVDDTIIVQLLSKHGYKKRKAKKSLSQKSVENRNEQFENIKKLKEEYLQNGDPVISIDTKKKNSSEISSGTEVYTPKKP
jgi:hypothetical protein